MKNKGLEWGVYRDSQSLEVIIAFGETHAERLECAQLLSDSGSVVLLCLAMDKEHAQHLQSRYNLDAHLARAMNSQGKYPLHGINA